MITQNYDLSFISYKQVTYLPIPKYLCISKNYVLLTFFWQALIFTFFQCVKFVLTPWSTLLSSCFASFLFGVKIKQRTTNFIAFLECHAFHCFLQVVECRLNKNLLECQQKKQKKLDSLDCNRIVKVFVYKNVVGYTQNPEVFVCKHLHQSYQSPDQLQ